MAETEPKYLAAPRLSDTEDFLREQAKFYNAILKDSVWHTLVPACPRCGSDNLFDNQVYQELICYPCGFKMSSVNITHGRIALR